LRPSLLSLARPAAVLAVQHEAARNLCGARFSKPRSEHIAGEGGPSPQGWVGEGPATGFRLVTTGSRRAGALRVNERPKFAFMALYPLLVRVPNGPSSHRGGRDRLRLSSRLAAGKATTRRVFAADPLQIQRHAIGDARFGCESRALVRRRGAFDRVDQERTIC
jgi:hypothetical protein